MSTGPKLMKLTPPKTYASEANVIKAVANENPDLRYLILQTHEGRFYPVFIGIQALNAMVHFRWCVAA